MQKIKEIAKANVALENSFEHHLDDPRGGKKCMDTLATLKSLGVDSNQDLSVNTQDISDIPKGNAT